MPVRMRVTPTRRFAATSPLKGEVGMRGAVGISVLISVLLGFCESLFRLQDSILEGVESAFEQSRISDSKDSAFSAA
jgi:hypothetical protein